MRLMLVQQLQLSERMNMHEVSIAEGIISIVKATAQANGITRVSKVRVCIGTLAGVDIPSLRFAWTSVIRGTIAENCALEIDRPRGQAWCLKCSHTVDLDSYGQACPLCGSYQLTPIAGNELKVIDIVGFDE